MLGGRILIEGSYVRRQGYLRKFLKEGDIVFLDEISSLPPQFTILLNEIIDNIYRKTANPNFYIFFAGNPPSYLGTSAIPDSLLERLTVIWFDYYPMKDEVIIVKNMVSDLPREIIEHSGFEQYIKLIVGIIRNMREQAIKMNYHIPLSVRSIATVVRHTIILSTNFNTNANISKVSLYDKLKGKLPTNLVDAFNDMEIENLVNFMKEFNISWNIIHDALLSLGSITNMILRGDQNLEMLII